MVSNAPGCCVRGWLPGQLLSGGNLSIGPSSVAWEPKSVRRRQRGEQHRLRLDDVKFVECMTGRGVAIRFVGESFEWTCVVSRLARRRVLSCLEELGFRPFTWPTWPGRKVYARRNEDIDWLPVGAMYVPIPVE